MSSGRKWSANARKRARKRIAMLLVDQHHACHWCGQPIIDPATIPAEQIVKSRDRDFVAWQPRHGELRKRRIATVDHVVPLSAAGPGMPWVPGVNEITNLVASCAKCNRERTSTPGRGWHVCTRCGVLRVRGKVDECTRCVRITWCELSGMLPGDWDGIQGKVRGVPDGM